MTLPASSPETSRDETARSYARPLEVITIVSVLVLDQLTKYIIRATLPLQEPA